MHSDGYRLFANFWWLLFPLFWAIGRMIRLFLDHKRAAQALEVVKSYADQGKEMPPEIIKVLQQPAMPVGQWPFRSPRDKARGLIFVGLIFVALACAFPVLIYGHAGGNDPEDAAGLWFVTVLMAGFAAAFFLTAYLAAKDSSRLDPR